MNVKFRTTIPGDLKEVDQIHIIYITRGARSGILAELIPGIRSRASVAPSFCTSAYLQGNPWSLGTEIYVLVPGGFAGKCGLIMTRKLSITSIQKLSIRFLIGPARIPRCYPMVGASCSRTKIDNF